MKSSVSLSFHTHTVFHLISAFSDWTPNTDSLPSRRRRYFIKRVRMEAAGHCGKSGLMKGDKASKNKFGAANPTEANQDAPVQSVDSPLESWIFSTAACYHVTQQREILENYTSGNFGKVRTITGAAMDVVGKGDVRIKLSSNATWILRDVKHIPACVWNLISVGQLAEKGYRMILSSGSWKISTGDFAFTVPVPPPDPNQPMHGSTYLAPSP
ncbi:putative RNA-directed DNA polymerase [Rosa chinensis]|uniref:Putative RNA-directed DNA polymerase n=1 Tax=Rosa chinensis TaxID=74649 RepID=A0A2P6QA80_ROSCH|nr:putative RNA-directed DNA polymerase [Rosa chinensis]